MNQASHRPYGKFPAPISGVHSPLRHYSGSAGHSNEEVSEMGCCLVPQPLKEEHENGHLDEQLGQAQKMYTLGTLACGICHDFNNILTAMLGHTELALITVPKNSQTHSHLQQVLMAGKRAEVLAQQILKYSRKTNQERESISLFLLVKEVLSLLRTTLPAAIEIHAPITDNVETVFGNPSQIHQVVMNLCTNAAYAMRSQGGVLEVSLETVQITSEFQARLSGLKIGEHLQLTVRDTGHGMTPAVMKQIFDPFFTTKEVGEGTGMGLAVVHEIIHDHGGTIMAESALGEGSTFIVHLPRIALPVDHQVLREDPIPSDRGCNLFVDDEEAIAKIDQRDVGVVGV